MNKYKVFQAEFRRWAILQALSELPGERVNSDILQLALVDAGYECSYGEILQDLDWLAEQGLIVLAEAGELQIARLTRRGGDAASGREQIPGTRRPLSGKIGI
jgi:hypothetical protein